MQNMLYSGIIQQISFIQHISNNNNKKNLLFQNIFVFLSFDQVSLGFNLIQDFISFDLGVELILVTEYIKRNMYIPTSMDEKRDLLQTQKCK